MLPFLHATTSKFCVSDKRACACGAAKYLPFCPAARFWLNRAVQTVSRVLSSLSAFATSVSVKVVQIDAMVNCANHSYQLGTVSWDMQFLHLHIWPKELHVCLSVVFTILHSAVQ